MNDQLDISRYSENAAHHAAAKDKAKGLLDAASGSASEHRGTRCPICFWALYDGDWCQGPKWCVNRGKSVEKPIRLTNAEAMEMIRHHCPTCGRHVPCRHCEPNDEMTSPQIEGEKHE